MSTDWLGDLEAKVQSVTEEIKALRKENASQSKKIDDLEKKLAKAEESGESSGDWEKLATGLEKLV